MKKRKKKTLSSDPMSRAEAERSPRVDHRERYRLEVLTALEDQIGNIGNRPDLIRAFDMIALRLEQSIDGWLTEERLSAAGRVVDFIETESASYSTKERILQKLCDLAKVIASGERA